MVNNTLPVSKSNDGQKQNSKSNDGQKQHTATVLLGKINILMMVKINTQLLY